MAQKVGLLRVMTRIDGFDRGSGLRVDTKISGCQPRRYSSPAMVYWVHQIGGPPFSQRLMQTLQPMQPQRPCALHERLFPDAEVVTADARFGPRCGARQRLSADNAPGQSVRTRRKTAAGSRNTAQSSGTGRRW